MTAQAMSRSDRVAADATLWRLVLVADTPTLLRQTAATAAGRADLAYAAHSAFRRLLSGDAEPLTFCAHPSRDYHSAIEAWSTRPLAELERIAMAAAAEAGPPQPFRFAESREAPLVLPQIGTNLRFALRCAPLVTSRTLDDSGRRGTTHEADAFAVDRKDLRQRAGAEGMAMLDRRMLEDTARAGCYRDWLMPRLAGCQLTAFALERFRIETVLRGTAGKRQAWRLPVADLSGILVVDDPVALRARVVSGIGRHKAWGMGMLQLGPPP